MPLPPLVPDARWAVWLLGIDGTVHSGDIAAQAFARHAGAGLAEAGRRTLIGAMRGFLEGRRGLLPAGVDLSAAQTGQEAVRVTARSLGVSDTEMAAAWQATRLDLAGTAWMLDPADGLTAMLAHPRVGPVTLVPDPPGDPAVGEVLDAVGAAGRVRMATALPDWASEVADGPVLVLTPAWNVEASAATQAGAAVVVLDRFGRRAGTPTLRVHTLTDMVAEFDRPHPARRPDPTHRPDPPGGSPA